jgi:PAS domain S-box-containing protein
MIVVDQQGRIVLVNTQTEKLLGYAGTELVGRPVEVLVPGRFQDAHARHRVRYSAAPRARPIRSGLDLYARCKDGTEIPVDISLSPIRTNGGMFVVAAIRDVTERKQLLDEMRLIRTIVQAISEAEDFHTALSLAIRKVCEETHWDYGEAWVPCAGGNKLVCSPAWYGRIDSLRSFRKASERITFPMGVGLPGRVWSSRQPEWVRDVSAEPPHVFLRAQAARDAGLKAAFAAPVTAGERVIAILAFFMFEMSDQDERLTALVSTVAAQLGLVMQRKQAEDAVRQAYAKLEERVAERTVELQQTNRALQEEITKRKQLEDRYHEMFKNAVPGMFETTANGQIVAANPAAARMLGYASSDEMIVAVPNVRAIYVDPSRREELLRVLEAHGSVTGFEVMLRRKDGTPIWVSASVTALRDAGGKPARLQGVIEDITERKRLEREILDVSELERRRIGQDLHDDLGQRLLGIACASQGLEEQLAAKTLPEASRSADITQLITQAIAQVRGLAKGLSPVEVGGGGLISALEQLAVTTERLTGIRCRLPCEAPVSIADDAVATQLYRIAQEAVNNAIKHGKGTHVAIQLAKTGDGILLSISDNGAGLPREVDDTQGMGLKIMRYRAGMIGSSLDVRPSPGGGTAVVCAVPLPEKSE